MNGNTNQPNILINQQRSEEGQKFKLSNFFKPKIIFTVLGIVILVELIFAVRSLQGSIPPPPVPILPLTGGSLEVLSTKSVYAPGDQVGVEVRLDTGGNSAEGVDIVLRFDPQKLSLIQDNISTGLIFPSYPLLSVDEKMGIVLISGISGDKGFNGRGILAKLKFLAREVGETSLRLEFNIGGTKDSNIVDNLGKDILEKVLDLKVEIL